MFHTVCLSDPRFESDGLRCVTVKSPALRGRGDVTVWAPDGERPVALVVLLHGVYGSHWSWALQGPGPVAAVHAVKQYHEGHRTLAVWGPDGDVAAPAQRRALHGDAAQAV